jgi:hypothetical protein
MALRERPVDLVEVDDVGLQTAQAVLHRLLDGLAREAALMGALAHGSPDLGGQHGLLTSSLESPADDLLGLALGVHVGGVDEVEAGLERPVDDADALLVAGVPPAAEHHGAETQR